MRDLNWRNPTLLLLALLAPLWLGSCIDGREEIHLNRDGSGRLFAHYTLPASAAMAHGGARGIEKAIRGYLEGAPGVEIRRLELESGGGDLQIRIEIAFRSHTALLKMSSPEKLAALPPAARHLCGVIEVVPSFSGVDVRRTIDPASAVPRLSAWFGDIAPPAISYTVHLPQAALESNATHILSDGLTHVWEYPVAGSAPGEAIEIRLKLPPPLPLGPLAATLAAVAAALGIFIWRLVLRTRRH